MKCQIFIFMLIGCALARNAHLDELISNNAQAIVGNLNSGDQVDARALNLMGAQRSITKRSPQNEEDRHISIKELFEKINDYLKKAWIEIKERSHKIIEDLKDKGRNSEAESVEKTLKFAELLQENIDERLENEDDETKKDLLEVWQSFLDKLQENLKEYEENGKTTDLEESESDADQKIKDLKQSLEERWAEIKKQAQKNIEMLKEKNERIKALALEKFKSIVDMVQEQVNKILEREDNETQKNILESMKKFLDKVEIKVREIMKKEEPR